MLRACGPALEGLHRQNWTCFQTEQTLETVRYRCILKAESNIGPGKNERNTAAILNPPHRDPAIWLGPRGYDSKQDPEEM